MAAGDLLMAEGWESGSSAWNSFAGTISTSYSRVSSSGSGVNMYSDINYAHKQFGFNVGEIMFGLSVRFNDIATQNGDDTDTYWVISWYDGASEAQLGINVNASHYLRISHRNVWDTGGTTLATGTTHIEEGTWYWMEGKFGVHNSTGYFQLYLNGNLEFDLTNVDTSRTGNPYVDRFYLSYSDAVWTAAQGDMDFDDLYMFDNTGDTLNYLGDIRILDLGANLDGLADWTPSTGGEHYALINERIADDADYVYTSVTGDMDTYYYDDLPANATIVLGVVHGIRAYKSDAGSRTLRCIQRQDSVVYERTASDFGVSLTPSTTLFYEPTNPATGNNWTVEDINSNAEFGFKLEA